MGALEPLRDRPGHELGIVVQGVAPTKEMAEEVCMTGRARCSTHDCRKSRAPPAASRSLWTR